MVNVAVIVFFMENKLCLNLVTSSYHFEYRCYIDKCDEYFFGLLLPLCVLF